MNDVFIRFVSFNTTMFFSECASRGACPDLHFFQTGGVDRNIGERNSFGSIEMQNRNEDSVTKCNALINEFRFFLLAEKMNLVSPFFENNCHPMDGTIHSFGEQSPSTRKKVLKMMFNQIEQELIKVSVANKSETSLCDFTW